ncbi:5'-nucleotidase C-terminal domain-containing protein [Brachybacterium avium]|uniref:5'-nucleotidase C-terminal domain-containing protein n=1 Tax=Brachybacterium avium TaxID=2017485 RepID=UPI001FEA24DC|nr:5'-nucleotidase C-terminal domain-containing protein [Brachybacterium avium]
MRPIIQTGASAENLGVVTLQLGEDGDWDVLGEPENRATALPEGTECAVDTEVVREVTEIARTAIDEAAVIGTEPVGSVAGDVTTSWADSKASYVDGIRTPNTEVGNQAITKGDDRTRHSAAGDMLADSMKWYLEDAGLDGEHEVIGFMNPGGIRAELWYDQSDADEGDGVVTYAEANSMVPFGNTLNSGEVTGAQFVQMLEEQWQRTADGGSVDAGDEAFLAFAVSHNVEYVFDSSRALDDRIVDIRIGGEPIDPDATYTIVAASFLFEGGDNMWALSEAEDVRDSGVLDRDAFIQYLEATPDLTPDFAQRQLEMQILDGGEYDSEAGIDRDPVLRLGNVESQSLGAPEIATVVVDAGEYGTFEAPYAYVEDAGRLFADVTLTDWMCVPEGTVVPLTITAIPETGTEIVTEIGSFTWTEGGTPDECDTDDGDDDTTPPPSDGDDDATTPPAGDGDDDATTPPPAGGDGQDGDNAQDGSTVATPVGDSTSGDTTAGGSDRSDLARTGVSLGSLIATISVVTLAGAGALALRRRMSQR